jgi:phosphopantothenoylcysteine decarboxylase/phosphopantothenate--cysteine ligase
MTAEPLTPSLPWEGKRVVLGVTGGIAAYKSVQLARDLSLLGAEVDTVLTRAARAFVAPLSFEGVTGRSVHTRLLSGRGAALHLELASEADLVLVAPATADLLSRAAHGAADDLLTTILLATRAPVLLAPSMNTRMWEHLQTQANVSRCRELGYGIVGPTTGLLAAGESAGEGRMVEPQDLALYAGRSLGSLSDLAGRRVLVTAGPTREPVDPVRYLGNRSSGRMGYALAREAWLRGCEVTLVTGPASLPDPVGIEVARVETADEMLHKVREGIALCDIVIYAAAVSDFRPDEVLGMKMKRSQLGGRTSIQLVENPDITQETRSLRKEGAVAVGFALETENLRTGAQAKLRQKGFDLIVGNDPLVPGSGFEVSTNKVLLIDREGREEELPLLSKAEVAARIFDRIRDRLSTRGGEG